MEAGDYVIKGTNRLGKEFGYIYYCGTAWDLAILLSKEKYAGSTNVTHELQKNDRHKRSFVGGQGAKQTSCPYCTTSRKI